MVTELGVYRLRTVTENFNLLLFNNFIIVT